MSSNSNPPNGGNEQEQGQGQGQQIGNDHLQAVMAEVVALLQEAGDLNVARERLRGWQFEHYAMLCALIAQGQGNQTAISATQQMLTQHSETMIGLLQTLFALGYAHGLQDAMGHGMAQT